MTGGGLVVLLAGLNPCHADEPWEVVYDGVDSAADGVANHLRWDSAIDDDWDEPGGSSFQLNTPTTGFMSVDRVTDPADRGKTGNIWIRDPILSHASGFTLEVGVKLGQNSDPHAFSMTYLDDAGSFGVHLSPGQIKAGGLPAASGGNTVAFDTTDTAHTYRVVKPPHARHVDVYVDGNPLPVVAGVGTAGNAAGSSPFLTFPRVLIGDNENNPAFNANYTLDFVRYRRGATAPGETPLPFAPRQLPSLPAPAGADETWTVGYDGTGQPLESGWIQGGGSVWFAQPDGIMELNTLISPANARLDTVPGWTNRSAVTVEARIKVLPDSEDGGFNLVANDQLGDSALVLSPDKVELMHAYMPVGRSTVFMDTTDDFHVYRMTRDAGSLYWHLYIDDDPVAAITHQHAGGTLLGFSRLWFGDVNFPVPGHGAHVLIDYIRWHQGSNAPWVPVLFGDANNDGLVSGQDLIAVQQNFGRSGPDDGLLPGDADDNGLVTGTDLIIILENFGRTFTPASVPEPGSLGWFVLATGATRVRSTRTPAR